MSRLEKACVTDNGKSPLSGLSNGTEHPSPCPDGIWNTYFTLLTEQLSRG